MEVNEYRSPNIVPGILEIEVKKRDYLSKNKNKNVDEFGLIIFYTV
jgi:hypothetical protein